MMMALYFMSNSLSFFRNEGKNSNIGFCNCLYQGRKQGVDVTGVVSENRTSTIGTTTGAQLSSMSTLFCRSKWAFP